MRTMPDKWKYINEQWAPYSQAVSAGFQHRFKQRVTDVLSELSENHVDYDIDVTTIERNNFVQPDTVKLLAESMLRIAAKMDIDEASKGI